MKDLRKHAEHTSETVRDLMSMLIIKHEMAALEIMQELKADNVRLRTALKVIRTWASVPGALSADDVVKLADKTLKP